jgi:hypothetical protein
MPLQIRPAVVLGLLLVLVPGCDEDNCIDCPRTTIDTPAEALAELAEAWRQRDQERYSQLLADDFRFYIEFDTRQMYGLPEYWDRTTDSAQTALLFESDEISDIRLSVLEFDSTAVDVNEAGREDWKSILVTDESLQVDKAPLPGESEGTTLLLEGQPQQFYFRKGRTPADTLTSSPTADQYFIVEWRDLGRPDAVLTKAATVPTTWSAIKSLYAL